MVINKPVRSATSEGGGTGITAIPYRNTANYTLKSAPKQDNSYALNTDHTHAHAFIHAYMHTNARTHPCTHTRIIQYVLAHTKVS